VVECSTELWVHMVERFRRVVYESDYGSRIKGEEPRQVRRNNLRLAQAHCS
jgi:hypothetical protein